MLSHYLTTAWRYFRRNQTFSIINLLGLTIGITACLLIYQYVVYEEGFDQHHENNDRIYRVALNRYDKGELSTQWAAGCAAIAPALKEAYPEVEAASPVRSLRGVFSYEGQFFREDNIYMVMPDFFRMFSFDMIEGNPEVDFEKADQIVLSASLAKKYFGSEDPIGKTLEHNRENAFTVVGVFEDFPEQSHMKLRRVRSA